jgi:hypothetical protein
MNGKMAFWNAIDADMPCASAKVDMQKEEDREEWRKKRPMVCRQIVRK